MALGASFIDGLDRAIVKLNNLEKVITTSNIILGTFFYKTAKPGISGLVWQD